mmetsp:Transcript_38526/g.44900  ORF Transcript_38526/g.44900 Transcript_38526/m.44900 type:complete len:372 (+) Transcript_38526:163-1278(+)
MFRRNSPKQPKLYDYAASCSDESNIYELINQRIKSHPKEAMYQDKASGFTTLHWLSCHEQPSVDTIRILTDANPVALMTKDMSDSTPLHFAVRHSSVDVVALLSRSCPEALHAKDGNGLEPLQLACRLPLGSSEKVKAIILISPEIAGVVSGGFSPLEVITQRYRYVIRRTLDTALESKIWNSELFQLTTCLDNEGSNLLEEYWEMACYLVKAMHYGNTSIYQPIWKMLHACLSIENCPTELIILTACVHPQQICEPCQQNGNNAFHMFAMNSTIGVEMGNYIMNQMLRDMKYIRAVGATNIESRVPLCIALEAGKVWEGGVDTLARAAPYLLSVKDPVMGIYPFMIASIGEASCINTIFNLLKLCPELIH